MKGVIGWIRSTIWRNIESTPCIHNNFSTGPSKENGILIGLTVGDLHSAMEELSAAKSKYLEIFKKDKQAKML